MTKVSMTVNGQAVSEDVEPRTLLVHHLREGLGLTSLYNEGLGSVNANHLYDRVKDRDTRHEKKPWEVSQR